MKLASFIKILIATLLFVSCQNPKEITTKENGKTQKIAEVKNADDFNKIFFCNDYSDKLSEYKGVILKKVNGAYSGVVFYYDTEGDASFNQINVINKVEVFKDSSFNISYDALTETGW